MPSQSGQAGVGGDAGSDSTTDADSVEGGAASGADVADTPAWYRLSEQGESIVELSVRPLALPHAGAGPPTAVVVRRVRGDMEAYGLNEATLAALEYERTTAAMAGDTLRAARATEGAALVRVLLPLDPAPSGAAIELQGGTKDEISGLLGTGRSLHGRSERRRLIDAEAAAAQDAVDARADAAALRGCLLSVLPPALRNDARHLSPQLLQVRINDHRAERAKQRAAAQRSAAATAATAISSGDDTEPSPKPIRSRHQRVSSSPAPLPATPADAAELTRPGSAPVGRRNRVKQMLVYAGMPYSPFSRPQSPQVRLDTSAQERMAVRLHDKDMAQRRKKMARLRDLAGRSHGPQWGCGTLTADEVEELGNRLYRKQQERTNEVREALQKKYLGPPTSKPPTLHPDEIKESNKRLYYDDVKKRVEGRQRLLKNYVHLHEKPKRCLSPERMKALGERLCPA